MKKTSLKELAEIIGMLAIVASLVFVGLKRSQGRLRGYISGANRAAKGLSGYRGLCGCGLARTTRPTSLTNY
jgi:hypothetical protein